MIEKIKKRIKEEEEKRTYSDELVKMIYEAVPHVAQQDFNIASDKGLEKRIKLLDDFKAYQASATESMSGI